MNESQYHPRSDDAEAVRRAHEGYVSGTLFARWMDPNQDIRTLIKLILVAPQLNEPLCDFFDGFITGAEAERRRQSESEPDAPGLPFAVEWNEAVDIGWGDTDWVVRPQDGPWEPHRP